MIEKTYQETIDIDVGHWIEQSILELGETLLERLIDHRRLHGKDLFAPPKGSLHGMLLLLLINANSRQKYKQHTGIN